VNSIPAARLGTPQDVAELTAFLCSEKASYITGQVIGVNGGLI
jgi:3-oxoacyl-[acyl-carrier protein] reductase